MVTLSYVNGSATVLDTPTPADEIYFETRPRLDLAAPVGSGQFTAGYEARLRSGASLPVLGTTSQFLNTGLQLPVGSRVDFRISDFYYTGTLETSQIDPGAEYFYGLAPAHRNDLEAQARVELGSRLFVDLGGGWNHVDVDQPSSFFSYDEHSATAALGLELGPNLRSAFQYSYQSIPFTPLRPEAQSTKNSIGITLTGDLTPLTRVELGAGYSDERNPLAGPGGQEYSGLLFSGRIARELSPGSTISLTGSRGTLPSGYEANGFYLSSAVEADLQFQLPLNVAFHGAVGYRWNDYNVPTVGTDVLRADQVLGYSLGLGRPLTRWAFLRVDYQLQHRTSNVPGLSVDTHSFILELGAGYIGGAPQP
jgi:hypothetical protein